MLKEISVEDALLKYKDKIVKILRPVKQSNNSIYYKMEDMSEYLNGCIFMIDEKYELTEKVKDLVKSLPPLEFTKDDIADILYPDDKDDITNVDIESNNEKDDSDESKSEKTANKSRNTKFDYGKLGALLDAGWKVSDIALEFKISKNTAYYHIRKYRDRKANLSDLTSRNK